VGQDHSHSPAWAAEALGKLGDTRAVSPLIQVLGDKDRWVRRWVAEALVKMGNQSVEPLIQALKDNDSVVHWYAAEALTKLGWQAP
jgi:HEAT repeat protein